MSIYCSFGMFDQGEEGGPPIIYRASHVMPSTDDPRGGHLSLAYIPGFITQDGRDVAGESDAPADHEGVWPFVRFTLQPDEGDTVVLDHRQVERLRNELDEWLLRCDDPGGWLRRREAER